MAPASLRVTHITSNAASIEWESPLDDGGAKITNYILEKRESGWRSWEILTTLPPSVRECELENMSPAKDYFVRIRAVNRLGQGPATEINTPIRVKGITKGTNPQAARPGACLKFLSEKLRTHGFLSTAGKKLPTVAQIVATSQQGFLPVMQLHWLSSW